MLNPVLLITLLPELETFQITAGGMGGGGGEGGGEGGKNRAS